MSDKEETKQHLEVKPNSVLQWLSREDEEALKAKNINESSEASQGQPQQGESEEPLKRGRAFERIRSGQAPRGDTPRR